MLPWILLASAVAGYGLYEVVRYSERQSRDEHDQWALEKLAEILTHRDGRWSAAAVLSRLLADDESVLPEDFHRAALLYSFDDGPDPAGRKPARRIRRQLLAEFRVPDGEPKYLSVESFCDWLDLPNDVREELLSLRDPHRSIVRPMAI